MLRFIIKSGFKSRAGYNGAFTVCNFANNDQMLDVCLSYSILLHKNFHFFEITTLSAIMCMLGTVLISLVLIEISNNRTYIK